MHRLFIKFGVTVVGLLAFLGVDLMLGAPLTTATSNATIGQVGAFLIGAGVGFGVILAGFQATPTIAKKS